MAGPFVGIVIPSYIGHLGFVQRQLSSYEVFCEDCQTVQTLIVVSSSSEQVTFRKTIQLRNVTFRVLTVEETIGLVTAAPTAGNWSFLEGFSLRGPPFFRRGAKHLLQSIKKAYGCLALKSEWCFATDSESFLLRPTSMEAMTRQYSRQRTIFHNSWYVSGCGHRSHGATQGAAIVPCPYRSMSCFATREGGPCPGYHAPVSPMTRDVLGARCARSIDAIGYANEVYNWFWERRVLLRLVETGNGPLGHALAMHNRKPVTGFYFIEEIYNQYVACFNYTEYSFVDTPQLLADMSDPSIRDNLLAVGNELSFLEVSGKVMEEAVKVYPFFVLNMSAFFKANYVRTFSASPFSPRSSEQKMKMGSVEQLRLNKQFLKLARINMCTSFCSEVFYDYFVKSEKGVLRDSDHSASIPSAQTARATNEVWLEKSKMEIPRAAKPHSFGTSRSKLGTQNPVKRRRGPPKPKAHWVESRTVVI